SAVLAVGPEGGWAPAEIEAAGRAGFTAATLGRRVLRTETAGIVAVALALFLAGEMGPGPGRSSGSSGSAGHS
ncbi:MAG TPA: RsmE family RNA methyltransferase, partial [Candidatus Polarisedimenticolia bacterium]|nr:RsmE family RNA methyltransferase [Candidatus Polarisedimenticolia bacterium]